jgi:hypothetical protein
MKIFEDIERRIDSAMRELFRAPAGPGLQHELVEIQRGILDHAVQRIERLPRARLLFPFRSVNVLIALPSAERRPAYEAVFAPDALRQDLVKALRAEGAEFPEDLEVSVDCIENAEAELAGPGFLVRYGLESSRAAEAKPSASQPGTRPATADAELRIPPVTLTALEGSVEPKSFKGSKARIHLGRGTGVQDSRMRLIRRNDISINDPEVSRAHAHIRWESGEFRLFDDGSSGGTSVWRDGQLLPVPDGPRGFALRDGDELLFGQSRIRFDLTEVTEHVIEDPDATLKI